MTVEDLLGSTCKMTRASTRYYTTLVIDSWDHGDLMVILL